MFGFLHRGGGGGGGGGGSIQDVGAHAIKMAVGSSPDKAMEEIHRDLLSNNMASLLKDLEPKKLLPYMTYVLDEEDYATISCL